MAQVHSNRLVAARSTISRDMPTGVQQQQLSSSTSVNMHSDEIDTRLEYRWSKRDLIWIAKRRSIRTTED